MVADGCQVVAIGRKGQVSNDVVMARQAAPLLAGRHVPQVDQAVGVSCREALRTGKPQNESKTNPTASPFDRPGWTDQRAGRHLPSVDRQVDDVARPRYRAQVHDTVADHSGERHQFRAGEANALRCLPRRPVRLWAGALDVGSGLPDVATPLRGQPC